MNKRRKVYMRGDILRSRAGQGPLTDLMLVVAGKRAAPAVTRVELSCLIAIIDREYKPLAHSLRRPLHPAQRIEIDLRSPAISKSLPGNFIYIQVTGYLRCTRLAQDLVQAPILLIHIYLIQLPVSYLNNMNGEGIDQLVG